MSLHRMVLCSLSLSLSLSLQIVCHCYTKPLEDSTALESKQSAMDSAAAASNTLKEQTKTHRLIFSTEPPSEHGACAYQPADPASLAVFTKVSRTHFHSPSPSHTYTRAHTHLSTMTKWLSAAINSFFFLSVFRFPGIPTHKLQTGYC